MVLKKTRNNKTALQYKIKGSGDINSTAKKSKKVKRIDSQKFAQRYGVKSKKIEDIQKGNLFSSKSLKKNKRNYLKNNLKVNKNPLQGSTKEKYSHFKKPLAGVQLHKESESIQVAHDRNKNEEKILNNQIFVSLDVLEDNEKSQRKLSQRKGKITSLNVNKKIPFSHKRFSNKNQHSQVIATEKTDTRKKEAYKKISESSKDLKEIFFQGKKIKTNFNEFVSSTEKQSVPKIFSNNETNTKISETVKTEFSRVDLNLWPFFSKEESPKSEISKVDEEYIKSLYLLASSKDTQYSINLISRFPSKKDNENQKKDQLSAEKLKNEKLLKKNEDVKKESLLTPRKSQKVEIFQQNTIVNTPKKKKALNIPLLRVLTKSDNRLKKKLRQVSRVESDIKITKNMNRSQTQNKDINNRKRRTLLTNTFRNIQKENNELSFSDKIADASDVKEIWKRDNRNGSENSFSSHSSTTVSEKHEFHDSQKLRMQSYNTLKKIVGLEIERITKSCQKEEGGIRTMSINSNRNLTEILSNTQDINKSIKLTTFNETERKSSKHLFKNICNENIEPATKNLNNFYEEEVDFVVQRRMIQVEMKKNLNRDCLTKGNQEIQDTHKFLHRNSSQEIKNKLKKLSEEKAPDTKIPEDIVKNWSILHRLQKAFLALGTPNFQGKTIGSAKIKSRRGTNKGTENYLRERGEEEKMKKTESSYTSEQLRNLKVSGDSIKIKNCSKTSNALNTTWETNKKSKKILKPTMKEEKKAEVLFMNRKSNFQEITTEDLILNGNRNKKMENNESRTLGSNKTKVLEENQKRGRVLNAPAITSNTSKSFIKPKLSIKDGDDIKNTQIEGKYNARKNLKLVKKIRDVPVGKFCKRKSSRVLACNANNQSKNAEENLERKRTFDVIPTKDNIDRLKSKSCYKLDKNPQMEVISCFPMTFNHKSSAIQNATTEFWDFFDENATNKANNLEKKLPVRNQPNNQSNLPKTENLRTLLKKPIKEKFEANPLKKNGILGVRTRNLANKDNAGSSKISLTQFPQIVQKQEKVNFLDELPPQILSATRDSNKSTCERAIKERSILSIRGNQHSSQVPLKNLTGIQRNRPSKFQTKLTTIKAEKNDETTKKENTNTLFPKNLYIGKVNCSESACSFTSTRTYNISFSTLPNISPSKPFETINLKKSFHDVNADFSSVSTISTISFDMVPSRSDSRKVNSKLNKPLWEKDIRHYKNIVKDIMNQYERTCGLLKQGTPIRYLKYEMEESENLDGNETNLFPKNEQNINIREYRRKIMSEYEAIPIFEYKSQIEKNKERVKEDVRGNRILKTVQILNTDLDLDIKDFQPNIHKVLDSQIYVDKESLCKRSNGLCKPQEKSYSLQEASLNKNEQNEPKWQSTLSMPKTLESVEESMNLMKIFWETPKKQFIKEKIENVSQKSPSLTNVTQTEVEVVDYSLE